MPLRKDIWRSAIARAPIQDILAHGLEEVDLRWLPLMGPFQFLADPFGLWRDGHLYLFAESFDYRVRIGTIEAFVFNDDLDLLDRKTVLDEPWHLSYPIVFEAEDDTWMLPEAHRSGQLILYRATDFPTRWERAHLINLDHVAIDATPIFHDNRWWLFYTSADRRKDKTSALNVAFADRLAGPWTPHPHNPVRRDLGGARPGGTAFVLDGTIVLPVQDCARTYGGSIRPLRIRTLSDNSFEAELGDELLPPAHAAPFVEGLHTLSAAGPVTLVDMKRTELSLLGLSIEARREMAKLFGRPG